MAVLFVPGGVAARERLRVRADTTLEGALLIRGPEGDVAVGTLRDDVGAPIRGAEIVLTGLPEGIGDPGPCSTTVADGPVAPPRVSVDGVHVRTDLLGRFCVNLASLPELVLVARYAGDTHRSASETPLASSTTVGRLHLTFEAPRLTLSLDQPGQRLQVGTRADGPESGVPIRLVLARDQDGEGPEQVVSATDVVVGAQARFEVESALLGRPGPTRLWVRFAGSSTLAAASEWVHVDREAIVELALASAVQPSDPAQGAELHVGARSSVGAAQDGWIEGLIDGQPSGLARVERGAARVVLRLAPTRRETVRATLRYVPASPGWVAAPGGLEVTVPLSRPGARRLIPWVLGAAAIAYFILRAWRRPPGSPRRKGTAPGEGAPGRAVVELVRASREHSGWQGRVTDAHDGTPIPLARVSLVVPAFDGEGVAATMITAEDGAFMLQPLKPSRPAGARLVVTAPHHASLTEALPGDGVLSISLVARRRELLDRLVGWAARAGRPWTGSPEPTPGVVAGLARGEQRADVEQWARAIDEAAFGPAAPDELRGEALRQAEPPGRRG